MLLGLAGGVSLGRQRDRLPLHFADGRGIRDEIVALSRLRTGKTTALGVPAPKYTLWVALT